MWAPAECPHTHNSTGAPLAASCSCSHSLQHARHDTDEAILQAVVHGPVGRVSVVVASYHWRACAMSRTWAGKTCVGGRVRGLRW
jgi:hypothetical protein